MFLILPSCFLNPKYPLRVKRYVRSLRFPRLHVGCVGLSLLLPRRTPPWSIFALFNKFTIEDVPAPCDESTQWVTVLYSEVVWKRMIITPGPARGIYHLSSKTGGSITPASNRLALDDNEIPEEGSRNWVEDNVSPTSTTSHILVERKKQLQLQSYKHHFLVKRQQPQEFSSANPIRARNYFFHLTEIP